MTSKEATRPRQNGANTAEPDEAAILASALAYEAEIAAEAAQIRQNAAALTKDTALTPELFMQLLPLLRRPIPPGFIVTTGIVTGKPYESTGIKSLQVQVNRLDNVLTPLGWGWETVYTEDGKLAHVTAWVGSKAHPLVERQARGGVDRANTRGNQFKGSETNAAKLALARLGVGHEVYIGAADFDPDTDEDAAKAQGEDGRTVGTAELPLLNAEQIARLAKVVADAGLDEHLPMKLRSLGIEKLAEGEIDTDQGIALYEWAKGANAAELTDSA